MVFVPQVGFSLQTSGNLVAKYESKALPTIVMISNKFQYSHKTWRHLRLH